MTDDSKVSQINKGVIVIQWYFISLTAVGYHIVT